MQTVEEHSMAAGCHADGSTIQCGLPQPQNACRPVVASDPFDAPILANSQQPVTSGETTKEYSENGDLGAGGASDACIAKPTSQDASSLGQLETLGPKPCQASAPLCSETPPTSHLRALRPSEAVRLLNSTPMGEVVSERQLYRHRQRATHRLGDGRRIDLYRYTAWLIHERRVRGCSRPVTTYATVVERGQSRISESAVRLIESCPTADEVIRLLKRQDYCCALSGVELTPETAALDHVIPIARGGTHSIRNAQILNKDVNRAKGTLTNAEFIALCRAVVDHVDSKKSPKEERDED